MLDDIPLMNENATSVGRLIRIFFCILCQKVTPQEREKLSPGY